MPLKVVYLRRHWDILNFKEYKHCLAVKTYRIDKVHQLLLKKPMLIDKLLY